jgi:hypothetical protein
VQNSNATLWILVGVLFLALAGVAGYKAWPLLYPEVMMTAPLDTACDLRQGPCATQLPDGGSVQFDINPRTIPPLKNLQLEVTTQGLEARSVEVDFSGVGMNMGFNRPKLEKGSKGQFIGEGMLPVCVRNSMEWEAKVLVQTGEGLLAVPFRFQVYKSDNYVAEAEAPQ